MPVKENVMFLPAIEEKKKREQAEKAEEQRIHLPDYSQEYEEYIKNKEKEKPAETVITIQIF